MPLPDGSTPTYNRATNNWANYIDLNLLGKHMWQPDYDPEGIISTIPAIVSCIIGILIGKLLDGLTQIKPLLFAGTGLLITGYFFSIYFPINKAIWSSSFVLVTSGWGTLILTAIFYLKDVKKYEFGNIFKYVGMNAITIYFLSSFISKSMYLIKVGPENNIHSWLYESFFVYPFFSLDFFSLIYAIAVVSLYTLLGYFMYKKKLFIKV
ncbi:hypothetical protein [Mariniflexile sp.]|uniref:hypothetical protein n=1 Tax=Mariniflexile sp. TaxID=1979402 RepID=UPI0035661E94